MGVLILKRDDLEQCVGFELESLAAVAASFSWVVQPDTVIPQPLHLDVPAREGSFDIKTAFVPDQASITVKIASGFFRNAAMGLPTGHSLMTVFSEKTGFVEAVLLDEGYLTDLRTALAGAVAAQHLARKNLITVGVLGTGAQARDQLRALKLVRDFDCVRAYGRSSANRARFKVEMEALLGCPVAVCDSVKPVVAEADCLITATPSRKPLVNLEDLKPGMHITAMGSDGPGKQELDPRILQCAHRLVCDLPDQARRIGESQWLTEPRALLALGDLVVHASAGRTSDGDLTVCDLTGIGTQDSAIAQLALKRARQLGLGFQV